MLNSLALSEKHAGWGQGTPVAQPIHSSSSSFIIINGKGKQRSKRMR
jgi:hypothetical protein